MSTEFVNLESIQMRIGSLPEQYRMAKPFPHACIDNMLLVDSSALENFPSSSWQYWNQLGDKYQHQKFSCNDIQAIPDPFRKIIHELCGPRFLQLLEKVTGIEKLIPDPYLSGGGLHLSGPGGILAAHTDFHIYRKLGLYRRINVILYLNESWQQEDGGSLELYSGNTAITSITPVFGRMAIFTTDDRSVHGFQKPIAEGKWRKSIALYYYTSVESDQFSGDETTYWRQHEEVKGPIAGVRFFGYRTLLNLSRGLSALAHVVNPHQGLRLVKTRLENMRKDR